MDTPDPTHEGPKYFSKGPTKIKLFGPNGEEHVFTGSIKIIQNHDIEHVTIKGAAQPGKDLQKFLQDMEQKMTEAMGIPDDFVISDGKKTADEIKYGMADFCPSWLSLAEPWEQSPQENAAEFDARTAAGFKLNLLTFAYESA